MSAPTISADRDRVERPFRSIVHSPVCRATQAQPAVIEGNSRPKREREIGAAACGGPRRPDAPALGEPCPCVFANGDSRYRIGMSAPGADLKNGPAWTSLPRRDAGIAGLWALIAVSSLAVLPPFCRAPFGSPARQAPAARNAPLCAKRLFLRLLKI